jgi:hypothetical protein
VPRPSVFGGRTDVIKTHGVETYCESLGTAMPGAGNKML